MPELPEVETVCRGLDLALAGKRIKRFRQQREDLRLPLPAGLTERLKGRRILHVRRRAKYILIALDKDETLLLHLGMSGRMVISRKAAAPGKHDHLIFEMADGTFVHFNDPRRFGMCDLVANEDLPNHKLLKNIGVEPLGKELTPALLTQKFKGKKVSVKIALMDQKLIAGVGNIYASEALFYAGINPRRRAGSCKKEQLAKLVPALRKVLNAAIKAGGSSLRDYRRADGELGYFQHHFAVYDRAGERCPGCICDPAKTGGVHCITQGGRSTYFCPVKQV